MTAPADRPGFNVGVDFDNTIVNYDELLHSIATGWGLLCDDAPKNKRIIRDTVRSAPDGEITWQRLQIAAYGLRMSEAVPTEGVKEFFRRCKERAIPVCIVSHKTTYPNLGESSVNLHDAALSWLEQQGFLAGDGIGIGRGNVYFESSRRDKIARIIALGVTHFVDDLEETFDDPSFPRHVMKILYAPGTTANANGATVVTTWAEISAHLFPSLQ